MKRLFWCFALTAASLYGPANYATTPWKIMSGAVEALSPSAENRLTTSHYRIGQWGVLSTESGLWHEEWFYPTAADRHDQGVFTIDAHKAGTGDFNGDGHQDMMISWVVFPHVLARPPIAPTVLLNESGTLLVSDTIWSSQPPSRQFAYHVGVGDFNQDGSDDAVLASAGIIKRNFDGSYDNTWERIPLMVSQSGQLADFSNRIAGQESEVLSTFTFAHDLSLGDVNGDGILDFYQGRHLFIGDGSGGFTPREDQLPSEASVPGHYVMASAMGDLDNDGSDDLVIGIADGQAPGEEVSGWIFLSNGTRSLINGLKLPLPAGRFGLANTKHNNMTISDVNNDGRLDILIGQTAAVPYYAGRLLQLFINKGNGEFIDESARVASGDRPQAQGEGIVKVLDVNGDGYPDIVDSAGERPDDVAILVNDGSGHFARMPIQELPLVQNYHLNGKEDWEGQPWGNSRTGYIYPIDLQGDGMASFLVQVHMSPLRWPMEPGDVNQSILYVIAPSQPYQPVAGPKNLSDVDCLMNVAEKLYPELMPDKSIKTARLEGFQYRYYPSSNTYVAVRGKRVLVYRPSVSQQIFDEGSIDQYMPMARAAGC